MLSANPLPAGARLLTPLGEGPQLETFWGKQGDNVVT